MSVVGLSKSIKYIPIIKWQQCEWRAITTIDPSISDRILPCVEIRTTDQHKYLLKQFNDLDLFFPKILVDYSDPNGVLTPSRKAEFFNFTQTFADRSKVIPTINPKYIGNFNANELEHIQSFDEITLRLRLDGIDFSDSVMELVKKSLSLVKKNNMVSLLIDVGSTPTVTDECITVFCQQLKSLKELNFSTIHFCSGAFPDSLKDIGVGHKRIPRKDWELWKSINKKLNDSLKIGFSDYGILTPNWTEEALTKISKSYAIKYTSDISWIVVRSAAKSKSESIAITKILVNLYRNEVKPREYSYGDAIIADRVDDTISIENKSSGNVHITEAWSHHMAFVVKEQY